jgi:ribosomal protein S18 acetylase RimI-like enzyme
MNRFSAISLRIQKDAKAQEAFDEMVSKMGHMGGPFYFLDYGKNGMVILEIKPALDHIRLSLVKVPPEYRGKGLASAAMKYLTGIADKHGVKITLTVQREEGGGLTKTQLLKWYERHGFRRMPYAMQQDKLSDDMERRPKMAFAGWGKQAGTTGKIVRKVIERRLEFVTSMGVSLVWIFPKGGEETEYWETMRMDAKGIANTIPVEGRFTSLGSMRDIGGHVGILGRMPWRGERGMAWTWENIEDQLRDKGWV